MSRCDVAFVGRFVCIDFEEVKAVRVVLFRHRINREHAWLKANRVSYFLLDRRLISRQLSRVYHELCNPHDFFGRLRCQHRTYPNASNYNSYTQDRNMHLFQIATDGAFSGR